MGTICEIELPASTRADAHADAAFAEIDRIEQFLSTWKPASELSRLNASADGTPHIVSRELNAVLTEAMTLAERTEGAFDPLVGPLVGVWQTRADGAVPAPDALAAAVRRGSSGNVAIADGAVKLADGAELEEGGFGKGYALDRALALLKQFGEPQALINFGGQIAVYGYDNALEVDVAMPDDRGTPALRLRVGDGSVSTSSGSEKTFEVGGRTFSHIIDPRTGEALPPRGSVTVITDRAFEADALSTALYVLGPRDGLRWADENDVAAIFLTPAENARGFEVAISGPARGRIREAQILNSAIHASNMKGFILK